MTDLFYIRYVGGKCGTTLERKLKKFAKTEYGNSVCTENAIELIFNQIVVQCDYLSKLHPHCQRVRVSLEKPAELGGSYKIYVGRIFPYNNIFYSILLDFSMLNSFFMEEHEGLWDIINDHALLCFSNGLSAYELNMIDHE